MKGITKRYGNCANCGRKGLTAIRTHGWVTQDASIALFAAEFILVDYGNGVYCCGDECYVEYRNE